MLSGTLYDALTEYQKLNRSSFHTPGHKGHNMLKKDIISFDLTELPQTDSLFEASGCIKNSEEAMAELYQTKKTLFSSGGNTLCIQTMIALAAGFGGKMIVGRNAHKSVASAMALLDIEPIWIMNAGDAGEGTPGRIRREDVSAELKKGAGIKAVFVTSPDYYGVVSDIKGIAEVCRNFNVPLIVDNAHGSHFMFMKNNMHPLKLGAAMSADSVHKTLPVLTGGALLHINDERYINDAKEYMGIFGSTSPSYPVMASIDMCRIWLDGIGRHSYKILEEKVMYIKKTAKDKGILIPEGVCDEARISLNTASVGYSGYEFREYLYKYKIEPEYCDDNYVVLIPSPLNKEEEFENLCKAIKNVRVKGSKEVKNEKVSLPYSKISIREALFSEHETVDINLSVGRVAAEIACPCPPGIPALMPGEIIGEYQREMLIRYGISRIKVIK